MQEWDSVSEMLDANARHSYFAIDVPRTEDGYGIADLESRHSEGELAAWDAGRLVGTRPFADRVVALNWEEEDWEGYDAIQIWPKLGLALSERGAGVLGALVGEDACAFVPVAVDMRNGAWSTFYLPNPRETIERLDVRGVKKGSRRRIA